MCVHIFVCAYLRVYVCAYFRVRVFSKYFFASVCPPNNAYFGVHAVCIF